MIQRAFVYPAHDETFFNDAFKMVKLDNILKDETGDVSVETLIAKRSRCINSS